MPCAAFLRKGKWDQAARSKMDFTGNTIGRVLMQPLHLNDIIQEEIDFYFVR
jgi:hypothetical protein